MRTKNKQCFAKNMLIGLISILAVYVRYQGRDFISADLKNCLTAWYLEITGAGPDITSLQAYTGDYPMPYAFLIWLLGKVPLSFAYSLKIVNSVFDFAQAFVIGKIVQYYRKSDPYSFVWGFGVALLLPNVFLNSAYWGQCDNMYCTFLFAALYCYLKDKYPAMMFMLGLAFSFKLQAVFMLPFVLIVYWFNRKFSILQFLIIPVTMMAMNIPAVIAGYSPMITFTKYMGQAGGYPWLYYFYPNLWFFFQARPYYLFSVGAIMLAVTALLIFVVFLVKKNIVIDTKKVLPVLLWTAYTCVFFLPSMHERYGYFAELIAVIWGIVNVKRIWIAVGMMLSTFPKYLYAIYLMDNPLWLQMGEAVVNTVVYLVFTCVLWKNLFLKKEGEENV